MFTVFQIISLFSTGIEWCFPIRFRIKYQPTRLIHNANVLHSITITFYSVAVLGLGHLTFSPAHPQFFHRLLIIAPPPHSALGGPAPQSVLARTATGFIILILAPVSIVNLAIQATETIKFDLI